MHVTTFYSFKGGVGRTQALVNVGAELAQRGRRVLLVDFDLEAPGIPTFSLPIGSTTRGGVVEYVSDYLATAAAPDVSEYITEFCPIGDGGGGLWIMPAGMEDEGYAERLNAIDWGKLYSNFEGYYLFEDLKLQWAAALRPDYVLVDSRTGHTDIGGICTRQLPDNVVIVFLPNDQNLSALPKVVSDIRDEAYSTRRKRIQLDFIVSNVPNIDDEDGILQARLERCRAELGYDNLTATIHRYDSLSLLDQSVFTLARPRTRLAAQYRTLADKLMERNLADRDGAVAFLASYARQLRTMSGEQRAAADERLERVGRIHSADADILLHLGRIRIREGKFEQAVTLFEQAIQAGGASAEALLGRAEARFVLGEKEAAAGDLRAMLAMNDATDVDVTRAMNWLREIDKDALRALADAPAVRALDVDSQMALATDLQGDREGQEAAVAIFRRALQADVQPTRNAEAWHNLGLCLIGLGRFGEAVDALRRVLDFENSVAALFNYAMARWGESGEPDVQLFRRVAEKQSKESDIGGPNYPQCLAVVSAVLGDDDEVARHLDDARSRVQGSWHRVFSCWRYLAVSPPEFLVDLDSIARFSAGERVAPAFILSQRSLPLST